MKVPLRDVRRIIEAGLVTRHTEEPLAPLARAAALIGEARQ